MKDEIEIQNNMIKFLTDQCRQYDKQIQTLKKEATAWAFLAMILGFGMGVVMTLLYERQDIS